MAIVLFKLDKLFILHVPFLIIFRHGFRKALLQKWVDVATSKKTKRAVFNVNAMFRVANNKK
jgi:hypothetical protein